MSLPISVGILTRNSGRTLARALDSVRDFDDLIICDGNSTDNTLAIAEQYGARIIRQDLRFQNADGSLADFSGVRNQLVDAARHDLFLYIDSDETISAGLLEDIRHIAQEPPSLVPIIYRVPIGILIDGRQVKYSTNYPGYQYRFFDRRSGARFFRTVHERIGFDEKKVEIKTLTHPWYIHTTLDDWRHYLRDTAYDRRLQVRSYCSRTFGGYLRYTLFYSLGVFAATTLKACWIYLRHGFRDSMPVSGEFARAVSPLLLIFEVTACHLRCGFGPSTP